MIRKTGRERLLVCEKSIVRPYVALRPPPLRIVMPVSSSTEIRKPFYLCELKPAGIAFMDRTRENP
jgi:hypothetical protein